MTAEYPLTWPDHIERSKQREPGKFKATLAAALNNVRGSLRLFAQDSNRKVESLIISSNVSLTTTRPLDPGVAVWFIWDGEQICFPVDRYTSVEANLQAVHHIIEADRTKLRHGTLQFVKASFRGFQALPPPPGSRKRAWREILEITAAKPHITEIEAQYRTKAKSAHPDAPGGSHDKMSELNRAKAEATKEVGA